VGGAAKAGGRPAITVRTLALGLVLLVAFIVVAPTLRAYLTQREQFRRLNAELATVEADVEYLDAELRRWTDPGYVQAQARERLSFVMPGEVAFRVVDPQTVIGEDAAVDGLEGLTEAVGTAPAVPWYLTLWDSVVEAGEPLGETSPGGTEVPGTAAPGTAAPEDPRSAEGGEG
jgi:cell division protein FtsB